MYNIKPLMSSMIWINGIPINGIPESAPYIYSHTIYFFRKLINLLISFVLCSMNECQYL